MRIDLHCHTKSTKQVDGDCRNVTSEVFKEKVIIWLSNDDTIY